MQKKGMVNYTGIISEVRQIIGKETVSRDDKLQTVCDLLQTQIDEFDWVGFYLANPKKERELILGPFTGEPTEHTNIPFGRGICGQSAETKQTFVVQDVGQADNYLSCSIDVKAEIVVPILKDGVFVGQIDIDSHTRNAITPEHQQLLENICNRAAELF